MRRPRRCSIGIVYQPIGSNRFLISLENHESSSNTLWVITNLCRVHSVPPEVTARAPLQKINVATVRIQMRSRLDRHWPMGESVLGNTQGSKTHVFDPYSPLL